MAALEPVVELLLQIGISSPEAESLLRGLIVHTARDWLAAQNGGVTPSDVRVALVTGVHRNFVHEILSEPVKIAPSRESRAYLHGKLLRAWHTDPGYRDDNGKPRDLPEKGAPPSFAGLVAAYLPEGTSFDFVLQELERAGAVESLSHHRVRVRSRTWRAPGLNLDSVSAFGVQAKALLTTLTGRLSDPKRRPYCDSTPVITVGADRIAIVREVVARRANNLIRSLEEELAIEARHTRRSHKKVALSITVVETAGPERARARRGRGKAV